ncbi:hypothetical protein PsYK624_151321 [Phanerochaete sordida]|uniref:Uncharacterized protein n=1 Tax=Phanerochaete sordida TaxID=48140 RepID=A0A9P3GQA0_9APHY|nr:hypothetical protein PsYK624_151321 [Phanerochaete sordida]
MLRLADDIAPSKQHLRFPSRLLIGLIQLARSLVLLAEPAIIPGQDVQPSRRATYLRCGFVTGSGVTLSWQSSTRERRRTYPVRAPSCRFTDFDTRWGPHLRQHPSRRGWTSRGVVSLASAVNARSPALNTARSRIYGRNISPAPLSWPSPSRLLHSRLRQTSSGATLRTPARSTPRATSATRSSSTTSPASMGSSTLRVPQSGATARTLQLSLSF